MTLRELAAGLESRDRTAPEVVDAALAACATTGREYNAVVDAALRPAPETELIAEQARAAAVESAARRDARQPRSALDGVPYAIKDVVDLAGVTTTMGSHVHPEAPAGTSAAVVETFSELGMIPVAKTTCHEHSYGIMGDESAHGRGVNPLHPGLLTGGSSYGSAIAVATGVVPAAIGTDTAGSVRVPAACAGITGLKPTLARIPTYGVSPLSTSLDTVGFFTRTPADMQLLWREYVRIAGDRDGADPAAGDRDSAGSDPAVRAVRLGVLTTRTADNGADWFDAAARPVLAALPGIELVVIDEAPFAFDRVPDIFAAVRGYETYQVHTPALRAGRRDFQPQVLRNLDTDAHITPQEYEGALAEMADLRRSAESQLAGLDALVLPTLGTDPVTWDDADAHVRNQLRLYTQAINLLGWPAMSVPVGRLGAGEPEAPAGFPPSVQFVKGPGADSALVDLVAQLAWR